MLNEQSPSGSFQSSIDNRQSSILHVAVACGGTGGHIFPGLATAKALTARGHNVSLWLAGKEVENAAVKGWQGGIVTVMSEGFQYGVLRSFLTVFRILKAIITCWRSMRRQPPDVVLAMGSYTSIGPCFAARLCGIPYVLHEANAVPGKAVRLLAGRAAAVGICFDAVRYHLKGISLTTTGMPLRPEMQQGKRGTPVPSDTFSLFIMGGSGGAHDINEIVSQAVCELLPEKICVTHLTGAADKKAVSDRYNAAGINAAVFAFTHDMATLYQKASLAICRSGASTCFELGVFGIPALLIPYPHAAGDHQTANARALEKTGAVDVIDQSDLTVEWCKDYLAAQMENPARLEQMRACAAAHPAPVDAAEQLADLVEQCARK